MISPPVIVLPAREILEGQCVIVLGPNTFLADAGNGAWRPIKEVLLKTLANKYGIREEVTSFEALVAGMPSGQGRFLEMQLDVSKLLQNWRDSASFNPISDKLAQLPVDLVFNAGLDNLLEVTFQKLAIPFRSGFYDSETSEQHKNDSYPFNKQFPTLIYCLYGSLYKPESLVLTSRDQTKHEKSVIRYGLPLDLEAELSRKEIFIFLGFESDDWYTSQTFKTLFSEQANSAQQKKIFIGNNVNPSFLEAFDIKVYPMEINEFVDQVYDECFKLDPLFESRWKNLDTVTEDQNRPKHRYPGLRAFERNESDISFARDWEVEEFANLVIKERIAVLSGKGGVGKTTLLQSACAHRWTEQGFVPIFIRTQQNDRPLLEYVGQMLEQSQFVTGKDDTGLRPNITQTLWEKLKRLKFTLNGSPAVPVLVFDQFEEVFLQHSTESRQQFFRELAALANETMPTARMASLLASQEKLDAKTMEWWQTQPKLRIVISIRDNFLSQLEELSTLIPSTIRNRFNLGPFTIENARQALVGPAGVVGNFISPQFSYTPEAINQILDCLSDGSNTREIDTFQLQLIGQNMEELVIQKGELIRYVVSPEVYGGEEGLWNILQGVYTKPIEALEEKEQEIAKKIIEDELLSSDNRRLIIPESLLLQQFDGAQSVLQKLVDARLLRIQLKEGDRYYEIGHDVLLPAIIQARSKRKAEEAEATALEAMRRREKTISEEIKSPEVLIARFKSSAPKYLLAIEGYGVETLGQLALLAAFEARMQQETSNSRYRLSDTFDLIGGAGLGNFVAMQLGLGRAALDIYADFKELNYNSTPAIFGTIGQAVKGLIHRYTEDAAHPAWKTGVCFLTLSDSGEIQVNLNHPVHPPLQLSFLEGIVQNRRISPNTNEDYFPEICPPDTLLLHVATHPKYAIGWALGETDLHILSIENPVSMPDAAPNQSQAATSPVITPRETQVRLNELAQWIHTGNKGKSPLGFQPAQVTRLRLNLDRRELAQISDWEKFYERATDIVASTDLSPFLPKVVA